jgi:hypothetical protein
MDLKEWASRYVDNRDVTDAYANQLRWAVMAFERTIGRTVDLADLSPELVNRHLKATRDTLKPETRKTHRRVLLTLWQAAADDGLAPEPIRRKVMPIRVPDKLQRAWDVDQVRMLLAAADRLKRYYPHGIAKRDYWRSYVMAAWDTGLRGCDMRKIAQSDIGDDGRIVLVQKKTGRIIRTCVRAETLAAINNTFPPDREQVWPLWARMELWRREASKLVRAAGLKGSIGQLRHSSGTAVEQLNPGHGHEHLGNTRAVFERHYLDRTKTGETGTLPPKL